MDTSLTRLNDLSKVAEIPRRASDSGHSYGNQQSLIKQTTSFDLKTSYHQIKIENSGNTTVNRPLPFGVSCSTKAITH